DSFWLLVAHCLSRFEDQPEAARVELAERCAYALEQFKESAPEAVAEDGVTPLDEVTLSELDRLVAGLKRYSVRSGQEQIASVVLDMSGRMVTLGALTLAFATVGSTREAVRAVSARTSGLMLAEQGRIQRLLGNLDEAEALYGQVRAMAERTPDALLRGRAAIGRGVIARVRGNYPKAREFFSEALEVGEAAGIAEVQRLAHHGLMIAAATGGDFDDALRHGWLAFVNAAGSPKDEGEALQNLAQVSLDAGYPRAALQSILKAMPNDDNLRVLLPGLATAAVAAGRCGELALLDTITARVERLVAASKLPFENASALISVARAQSEVGHRAPAQALRARAKAILAERNYHELEHRIESDELTASVTVQPRNLDRDAREVVRSLEQLEAAVVF
ncbi:MAG: tetratricopeptide repeat protein, partial [Gemmatimonadaceae bacterium]